MGRPKGFNKEDVLNAAIQLFWKKGFADTSLSDLEKATGVNKSGLYAEWKDKDHLYLESIRHYMENSPNAKYLQQKPLGWKNIEDLLKGPLKCTGMKGCFCANTMREYAIIPEKVKTLLGQNSETMRQLVIDNIKATKTKKDPEILATMIMTFASGISMKLNAVKADQVIDEIDSFLALIK